MCRDQAMSDSCHEGSYIGQGPERYTFLQSVVYFSFPPFFSTTSSLPAQFSTNALPAVPYYLFDLCWGFLPHPPFWRCPMLALNGTAFRPVLFKKKSPQKTCPNLALTTQL